MLVWQQLGYPWKKINFKIPVKDECFLREIERLGREQTVVHQVFGVPKTYALKIAVKVY